MKEKRFDIEKLWWDYLTDVRYEKISSKEGYDRKWTYREIVKRYNDKYGEDTKAVDTITVDQLKFYFNGYRQPRALRFLRICDVMEINPIDIFFNESVMQAVSNNDFIKTCFNSIKKECDNWEIDKNYDNSDLIRDLLKIFESQKISSYAVREMWLDVKDSFNFKKERSLEPSTLFKYKNGEIDEMSTFTMFVLILMNYRINKTMIIQKFLRTIKMVYIRKFSI